MLAARPRRAGGGVDGGRRGTTRTPTDGGRLDDAGSDGSPALGAGPTSVRHGCDGRRGAERWKTDSGAPLPGAPKCRITGSGRPLRFELWGARGDRAIYLSVSQRSNY